MAVYHLIFVILQILILELAEKVIDLTNSKSKIDFHPLPGDDPKQRCPDITLAKEKLDWEPKITLDEGLVPTISYFESRMDSIDV